MLFQIYFTLATFSIWTKSWLFSTNHKVIAFLYFIFGIFAVVTILSLVIHLKLSNISLILSDYFHFIYEILMVYLIPIQKCGNFFFSILIEYSIFFILIFLIFYVLPIFFILALKILRVGVCIYIKLIKSYEFVEFFNFKN